MKAGVNIATPLFPVDYHRQEFVIEDIDGNWLGFGIKDFSSLAVNRYMVRLHFMWIDLWPSSKIQGTIRGKLITNIVHF